MSELPFVVGLCASYARPRLVANIMALFAAQDYPEEKRLLYVLDDSGHQWEFPGMPENVRLEFCAERFPNLSAKYNYMVASQPGQLYLVIDDDDIYLPWHFSAYARALVESGSGWVHPRYVWTLYGSETPQIEQVGGRFHGALGLSWEAWHQVGGWPETLRADFDQQMIGRLNRRLGPAADPTRVARPSYIFRWASTGHPHAQWWMRSPDNTDWYAEYARACKPPESDRVPVRMDEETEKMLNLLRLEENPLLTHRKILVR